ncbi:MAG: hypothetical protein ACLSFW_26195 [Bacteroides cellulosilyticus]
MAYLLGIVNHGITCISFADTAGITGESATDLIICFPIGSDMKVLIALYVPFSHTL